MSRILSEGVIQKILSGEIVQKPVLQILGFKKVPGNNNDRYRLLVSDGMCGYSYVILGTQLSGLITNGNLEKYTIVQVNNYVCTRISPDKKIIVFLELEIISPGREIGERVGNPTPVVEGNVSLTSVSPNSSGTTSTSLSDSTPNSLHQVVSPDKGDVLTSPSTSGSVEHQTQTVGLASVPISPSALRNVKRELFGSSSFSSMEHQIAGPCSIPTSPSTLLNVKRELFGPGNASTSSSSFSSMEHPIAGTGILSTSPSARSNAEHQISGSGSVQTSSSAFSNVEHDIAGPGSAATSPNTCHSAKHRVTSPGSASTSPNASRNVHPITNITPYQNKWTIRARVTNKSLIHEYSNSRREGKLFSVDFVDESGEIRAVLFNEYADKYYNFIEEGKVYYVSDTRLKPARKKFSSVNNNYEMIFTANTTIVPCEGNYDFIPSAHFNFITIDVLETVDIDSAVDVLGVCRSAHDVEIVLSRSTSREIKKRDIILIDQSNSEITLTLWGDTAETFDGSSNPVVALKGAKITDFRLRSLSAMHSTVILINPDITEARALREWFDTAGRYVEFQSISQPTSSSFVSSSWKTLAETKEGMQGVVCAEYYRAKATVVTTNRENCMYMACPSDGCRKKVNALDNGKYECTKCRLEHDTFKWRFLLSVSIADFSENQWAKCFDETAESLLNKSAQELQALKESDEDAYDEVFSKVNFEPYVFDMRTKMGTYNEENRLETIVISVSPVDLVEYSKRLLEDIKNMGEML